MHDFSEMFGGRRVIPKGLRLKVREFDAVIQLAITPHMTERELSWLDVEDGVVNPIVEVRIDMFVTMIRFPNGLDPAVYTRHFVQTEPFELKRVPLLALVNDYLPTEIRR